ncbi:TDT family transporter [Veronia pacifica]|uniref:Tellurium resistance protein n=1 Tax=Veronia pacifica TaxID=1080227 RepID=A0A1C3EQY4_9GAMM|nr:TDT family transporter [Veronia pacifica]ODA35655.1 tellurium resistance protein [Veronia pacifica]
MKFRSPFHAIPTAQASLAMAVVGLGIAWSLHVPDHSSGLRLVTTLCGFVLVLPVCLKYIFDPNRFISDLKHPFYGSLMAPMSMALMLIADYLAQIHVTSATFLLYGAFVLHVFMMLFFFSWQLIHFDMRQLYPSWFLYPVGMISSTLAGTKLGFSSESLQLMHFCIGAYFIMLPVILYRLTFMGRLQRHCRPVLAIMAAPVNLSLSAYLTNFNTPDPVIVGALGAVGIVMTIFVYLCCINLLRQTFHPGLAALTFPSVISAVAVEKLSQWLSTTSNEWFWLSAFGVIELMIATSIVCWVCFKYVTHFGPNLFGRNIRQRLRLGNS